MRILRYFLTAAIISPVPAHAWQFWPRSKDDPAITVCESYVKRAVIKTPSTYERKSARLMGRNVILDFDAQNEYGALIRSQYQCIFRFYDGSFHISDETKGYDTFKAEIVTIEALGEDGLTADITKLSQ